MIILFEQKNDAIQKSKVTILKKPEFILSTEHTHTHTHIRNVFYFHYRIQSNTLKNLPTNRIEN